MSRGPASFWASPRPRVSPLPHSGGPAWPSSWPDNHTLLPPPCTLSGPDCGQIQQLQSLRSLNTQFRGCELPKMCHPTTLPMALQVLLRKGRVTPGQVFLFSAHCCGKATSQSCQGPIMRTLQAPGLRPTKTQSSSVWLFTSQLFLRPKLLKSAVLWLETQRRRHVVMSGVSPIAPTSSPTPSPGRPLCASLGYFSHRELRVS